MLKKVLIATLLIGGTTAMADPQRDHDRRGEYDRHVDEGHKAGTWRTLADSNANGAERHFVPIGGRAAGDLHVIRLEAVRGVPRIERVEITFGDGSRQVVDLRQKMDRSNPAATIDLTGNTRYVENVVVYTDRWSYGEFVISGE